MRRRAPAAGSLRLRGALRHATTDRRARHGARGRSRSRSPDTRHWGALRTLDALDHARVAHPQDRTARRGLSPDRRPVAALVGLLGAAYLRVAPPARMGWAPLDAQWTVPPRRWRSELLVTGRRGRVDDHGQDLRRRATDRAAGDDLGERREAESRRSHGGCSDDVLGDTVCTAPEESIAVAMSLSARFVARVSQPLGDM